jgi:hypothetical protein
MATSHTETQTANVTVPVTGTSESNEVPAPQSIDKALEVTEAAPQSTEVAQPATEEAPVATEAPAPEAAETPAAESIETKPKIRRVIDEEGGITTASVGCSNSSI